MSDLESMLRLHLTTGIGMVTYRKLLRHFGSPEAVLAAPADRLAEIQGIGQAAARRIVETRAEAIQRAEEEMQSACRAGVRIVPHTSPDYPVALRQIYDPPLVLYIRGQVRVQDTMAVAIVGARRCSDYGRAQATRLAEGLAEAGFTVISGLAYGIDAAAHRGALRSTAGRTLAVLGNGLAQVYPPEHADLADEIAGRAALVSEFPMRTVPSRGNFPKRNRIISGLALGVIVVEGTETSGSLITARAAADQGKEVFAVPGSVNSPLSRGPHRLLREGAKLVETVGDVLEELGPLADEYLEKSPQARGDPHGGYPGPASGDARAVTPDSGSSPPLRDDASLRARALSGRERTVYEMLGAEPILIDELIHNSGLAPQEISGTLMVLEIKRLVKQLPGKRYLRA